MKYHNVWTNAESTEDNMLLQWFVAACTFNIPIVHVYCYCTSVLPSLLCCHQSITAAQQESLTTRIF